MRISIDGTVLRSVMSLGEGYSQTFGGQFVALYYDGAYSLLYSDRDELFYRRVGLDGSSIAQTKIASINVRYPSMIRKGAHFYAFWNEGGVTGRARVTVLDKDGNLVPGKSGPIGDGRTMKTPVAAYDATYDRIAVVYLDDGDSVVFQRLK